MEARNENKDAHRRSTNLKENGACFRESLPANLSEVLSLEMNVCVNENPPPRRLRRRARGGEKGKRKERGKKEHQTPRVQKLSEQQIRKLPSFTPSFFPSLVPSEETIPAALLPAASARTGFIWGAKNIPATRLQLAFHMP